MKKRVAILVVTLLFGFQMQAYAMTLDGEEKAASPLYKPTKSAVKKAMEKMGIAFTVDKDGDLEYKMENKGWTVYVVFNEMSSGELWNLQMIAQFGTKKSRYDDLLVYVNNWNRERKYPKVSMARRDSLRASLNYPVQYGFNPDEFEDNVLSMFESSLVKIADDIDEMRR